MQAALIGRRTMLAGGAVLLAAPAVLRSQTLFTAYPFRLGVASGDPAPDGFVLWTRLAPEPLAEHGGMPMRSMPVQWDVAADDRFGTILRSGEAIARPERGHGVHVEVTGLAPARPYWYRFTVGREVSPVGRTRTAPPRRSRLDRLRFGVAGCQQYEQGLYTAYRYLAAEELEFIYHYGDYIYETGRGDPRVPLPVVREHVGPSTYSLDDYRRRYAQYRMDPDLQAAHAAAPWFVTWDDHEVADNWNSEGDRQGTPHETFVLRRAAALQAWYEHMPVRASALANGGSVVMHRAARYGDLLHAHFLDTRQYRSRQACGDGVKPVCPDVSRPDATMLGADQEQWLGRGLADKSTAWNLVAQQVMMMDLDRLADQAQPTFAMDTWAGYAAPRRRLLERFMGLGNIVVLTGDEHQHMAGELYLDDKPVAVEFVTSSISSGGDGLERRPGSDRLLERNPQLKFINARRGYVTCDVSREEWRTNFMVLDQIRRPGGSLSRRAQYSVARGEPALRLAWANDSADGGPSQRLTVADPLSAAASHGEAANPVVSG